MQLIRDPELEHFLPCCGEETDQQLEADLVATNGPRDTLKVWNQPEGAILVDGYRRHAICTRRGLPFKVEPVKFADRVSVKRWMVDQQFSRRNMNAHDKARLLAKAVEMLVEEDKDRTTSDVVSEVAQERGVSERGVYRATKYSLAFDKLIEPLRKAIQARDLQATLKDVLALADYSEARQKKIVADLDTGKFATLSDLLWGPKVARVQPASKPRTGRTKPAVDPFAEVVQRMGMLRKAADDLGDARPSSHYQRVMDLLNKIDDVVKAWRKDE